MKAQVTGIKWGVSRSELTNGAWVDEDTYMCVEAEDTETKAAMLATFRDGRMNPISEEHWEWSLDFADIETSHCCYQYHQISQVMRLRDVECIVELGTWRGALSLYLGACGAVKDIDVYTVDKNAEFSTKARKAFPRLGIDFEEYDYLEDPDRILEYIAGRKVYLICDGDNENKHREFNFFVPLLAVGSVVSVHDWGHEVTMSDIEETVRECKMRPFGERDWLRHGVAFATFVKGE